MGDRGNKKGRRREKRGARMRKCRGGPDRASGFFGGDRSLEIEIGNGA